MTDKLHTLLIFVNILLCALLLICAVLLYRFVICFSAVNDIPDFQNVVLARCMVHGTDDTSASAVVKLYDSSGKELRTIERSWQNRTLEIDFAGCSFSGKTLLFPVSVSGVQLVPYYFTQGKNPSCALYRLPSAEKSVYRLARYALFPELLYFTEKILLSRHRIKKRVSLAGCESGVVYLLAVDSNGTIRFIRE